MEITRFLKNIIYLRKGWPFSTCEPGWDMCQVPERPFRAEQFWGTMCFLISLLSVHGLAMVVTFGPCHSKLELCARCKRNLGQR